MITSIDGGVVAPIGSDLAAACASIGEDDTAGMEELVEERSARRRLRSDP